jgi:hypothetical protein
MHFFVQGTIQMTIQFRKYLIFWGLFLMIFMAGVFAEPSIADMYKWVDENNVAHFSDTPPGDVTHHSDIETLPTYTTPQDNGDSPETHSTGNRDNGYNIKAYINALKQ